MTRLPLGALVVLLLAAGACAERRDEGVVQPRTNRRLPSDAVLLRSTGWDFQFNRGGTSEFTVHADVPDAAAGEIVCQLRVEDGFARVTSDPQEATRSGSIDIYVHSRLPDGLPLRVLEDLEPGCYLVPVQR